MNRDRLDINNDPSTFAFGDRPLEWRLPTDDGLTWRLATRDDMAELQALWNEMDRKLGKQDRPDLLKMPVLLTLVAVDDATGKIVSGVYGECVVDWTMIGTSRAAARSIPVLHPFLALFLWPRSIRVARVVVPKRLQRHMAKLMPQMVNITQSFAWFVYMVRV